MPHKTIKMATVDAKQNDASSKENKPSSSPSKSPQSSAKLGKPPINSRNSRSFKMPFVKNRSKTVVTESEENDEDDPVMALFAARNKQRVRFSLEDSPQVTLQAKSEKQELQAERTAIEAQLTPEKNETTSLSIKSFMKGAIFGKSNSSSEQIDEFDRHMASEIEAVGLSPQTRQQKGDAHVLTTGIYLPLSDENISCNHAFTEDKDVRAQATKLLNKASRARHVYFRYEYAVKVCVRALDLVTQADYPDDHPTVIKILQSLNTAHHALSSYRNSANIVRMGNRYEVAGELVRALKMYSIAYRIRRDNLSADHPSLIVLLNMLGSVQVKREELEEAMEIFEIAVKEDNENDATQVKSNDNLLAKSVAYREMGSIYERWQELEDALAMYNKSLACLAKYKGIAVARVLKTKHSFPQPHEESDLEVPSHHAILRDLESTQRSRSYTRQTSIVKANKHEDDENESGGMELLMGSQEKGWSMKRNNLATFFCTSGYDAFFPQSLESTRNKKKTSTARDNSAADIDIALTLHQIGQLHRSNGDFNLAIEAYSVALRGMKHVLGKSHPNCASILGNIGNLQKEMGDMNAAFETYQKVLAIESARLGLSHPDVIITLHNIATIDAARGNHRQALELYNQVIELQKKLFGCDHITLAVTTACKGDVYERVGQVDKAIACFDEVLRIKTAALGRHSFEVARILHKLGKLNAQNADFPVAESFISRAVLVYRLNKLPDDDEWLIDAARDAADIDAAISMGKTGVVDNVFEF
ncbi:hypothetical protein MPSEU_000135900 [Mayamaea pseudoterrestris]|nr:hypothetical protein MPSEU_000135900 [Mayamaea pseudoterrestris]